MRPALRLHALPGLGDAIHARGILPGLMADSDVWFNTPHTPVYHDMPGLHFGHDDAPVGACELTAGYHPNHVCGRGSVLNAMAHACGVPAGDFRLPIPREWERKAGRFMLAAGWNGRRPLAIYRPLVETDGADNPAAKRARNPDPDAYATLFRSIRDRYFVVAVADCAPGREWLIGPQIEPDADCTDGRLDFETLAALFGMADLAFCPPGFATVLAQAVSTRCVTVFGGFEDARSFAAGADNAPWLPIEPLTPCPCWSPDCPGDKTIDLIAALSRLEEFVQ